MYKLKGDGKVLKIATGEVFDSNSWLYDEYSAWIGDGNDPEPEYTIEEIRVKVIADIENERNRRIDTLAGPDREKRLRMMAGIQINKKRSEGESLSTEEAAERDELSILSDKIDSIVDFAEVEKEWVQDPVRVYADLEVYDTTAAAWPY